MATSIFRRVTPKNFLYHLPRTCDGFPVALGMTVYYPFSLDSMMGPHPVIITKMSMEQGFFMDGKEEYGASWKDLYWGESNAEQQLYHREKK